MTEPAARCRDCDAVALLRLRRGQEEPELLCERCAEAWVARRFPSPSPAPFSPVRFFLRLTRLAVPAPAPAYRRPDSDAACPSCGLTFGEFSRIGLAGCAGCYDAFREAILPALRQLSLPAPP